MIRTPDPADKYVGQQIKIRRTRCGMRQQDVAAALRISLQQYQKYETGHARLRPGLLARLARLLGVHAGYFFDKMPETIEGGLQDAPDIAGPDMLALIAGYTSLSKLQQDAVRLTIAAMREGAS
jgi:transcriptional regulator with XRE-family HTH domain